MTLQETEQELNEVKNSLRTAQLKIQHYREVLDQKEDRIAELRVEITNLQEALRPVTTEGNDVSTPPEDDEDPAK